MNSITEGKEPKRSICDITNDECLEIAKILGNADHITEASRIYQVKELLRGIFSKQTNLPGIKWIRVGEYLSSHGFAISP